MIQADRYRRKTLKPHHIKLFTSAFEYCPLFLTVYIDANGSVSIDSLLFDTFKIYWHPNIETVSCKYFLSRLWIFSTKYQLQCSKVEFGSLTGPTVSLASGQQVTSSSPRMSTAVWTGPLSIKLFSFRRYILTQWMKYKLELKDIRWFSKTIYLSNSKHTWIDTHS